MKRSLIQEAPDCQKNYPCQYQRECVENSVVKCILVLGCKGLIYQRDTYLWMQGRGWEGGMGRKDGEGDWGKVEMRKVGENYTYKLIFFTHSVLTRKTSTVSFLWYGTNNEINFFYVDFRHFSFSHSAANVRYFWCFSMNRNDNFKAIEVIVIVCIRSIFVVSHGV